MADRVVLGCCRRSVCNPAMRTAETSIANSHKRGYRNLLACGRAVESETLNVHPCPDTFQTSVVFFLGRDHHGNFGRQLTLQTYRGLYLC